MISYPRDESYSEEQARRLENMAARKRWNISDEIKEKVVRRAVKALRNKEDGPALKAARLLKDLEAQNQTDELAEQKKPVIANDTDLDSTIEREFVANMANGEKASPPAPTAPPE